MLQDDGGGGGGGGGGGESQWKGEGREKERNTTAALEPHNYSLYVNYMYINNAYYQWGVREGVSGKNNVGFAYAQTKLSYK